MKWKGKLIGLLLGLLTRRPPLILIGLVLGHLYDMGLFSGKPESPASPPPATLDPYAALGVDASASDEESRPGLSPRECPNTIPTASPTRQRKSATWPASAPARSTAPTRKSSASAAAEAAPRPITHRIVHSCPECLIAPSILSADFARLGEEVDDVLKAGADWVHFDVMDNHYVPNLTIGPLVCEALRKHGVTAPIDVHLMVKPVDRIIPDFAKAGASLISFHPEASEHIDRTIQLIHDHGCKAGLVFNPATPLMCSTTCSTSSTWC